MRVFMGLPLPSQVTERLASLRLRLATPNDGLRWASPNQWHITLQFLGEVESEVAARCAEALSNFEHPAMWLEIQKLGQFASKGLLYAALEADPSLATLHEVLGNMAEHCGICMESRPFRPHVTLARSKGKVGLRALQRLATPALPSIGAAIRWKAQEVVLFESILGPQGATYHHLARSRAT